jgi:hypothetical protein
LTLGKNQNVGKTFFDELVAFFEYAITFFNVEQLVIFKIVFDEVFPAGYGILPGFHVILLVKLYLCLQKRTKRVNIHVMLAIKIIGSVLNAFLNFLDFLFCVDRIVFVADYVENHLSLYNPGFVVPNFIIVKFYSCFGEELFAVVELFLDVWFVVDKYLCLTTDGHFIDWAGAGIDK